MSFVWLRGHDRRMHGHPAVDAAVSTGWLVVALHILELGALTDSTSVIRHDRHLSSRHRRHDSHRHRTTSSHASLSLPFRNEDVCFRDFYYLPLRTMLMLLAVMM